MMDTSITENDLVIGLSLYIKRKVGLAKCRQPEKVEVRKVFVTYVDMSYEAALLMLKERFGKSINGLNQVVPYNSSWDELDPLRKRRIEDSV
jgi:hypothetical protein